jgi:capsular polysaccharide biosynthesis protein
MGNFSYIAIIIGTCAVIITAFVSSALMLWVGARIYYEGTQLANPKVYTSTKLQDQKDIIDEAEVDIFNLGEDDA